MLYLTLPNCSIIMLARASLALTPKVAWRSLAHLERIIKFGVDALTGCKNCKGCVILLHYLYLIMHLTREITIINWPALSCILQLMIIALKCTVVC